MEGLERGEVQVYTVDRGQDEGLVLLVKPALHNVIHHIQVVVDAVGLLPGVLGAVVGDDLVFEEAVHFGVIVQIVQQLQFKDIQTVL